MNYEEKYKSALEWMRSIYPTMQGADKEDAEHYFPELRESEDERIRKELIQYLKDYPNLPNGNYCRNDFFAWLEKQGEQKPTDEIKPKFKVGDWITNGYYTWKVTDIKPLDYILQSPNGDVVDDAISYVDEHFHLWTIQDAKDGDVLATKKGNPFIYDKNRYNNGLAYYYAGLDVNKELTLKSPHHMLAHFGELHSVSPATKEQRDLLFQKMKEAGYKWDAEKKELKKVEQKPSWSEEDEEMHEKLLFLMEEENSIPSWGGCYEWLKSLKDRVQPQPKQEWSEEDEKMLKSCITILEQTSDVRNEWPLNKPEVDWLKSLNPQKHYKPSEEQMSVLQTAIKDYGVSYEKSIFESLYNDLKSL